MLGTTQRAVSAWPVVESGSSGHPIKTLQYLLRAHGFDVPVDGGFGGKTEVAVRAVQARSGLRASGIVDARTWKAVVLEVRKGSRGDAVRGLQEEFQFRNVAGDKVKRLPINGDFGPATDAAVRAFQHALSHDDPSVAEDGVVGPTTWQALVSGMLPEWRRRRNPPRDTNTKH